MTILRTGRRLGMILDGEDRPSLEPDAAIASIEQRNVRFFDRLRKAFPFHGEAVIHGCYFHLSRRAVHDGMVRSMMSMGHFYGAASKGQAE